MKRLFALRLTAFIMSTIVTPVAASPTISTSSAVSAVNVSSHVLRGGGDCDTAPLPLSCPKSIEDLERSNLAIASFDSQQEDIVTAYQPGNKTSISINPFTNSLAGIRFAALSTNGRLEAWYGNPDFPCTVRLNAIGEEIGCIHISVPQNYTPMQAVFLNDETGMPRYLTYVLVDNSQQNNWILELLNIYTHNYVEWIAPYQLPNNQVPPVGFSGVANVLGWRPKAKTIMLAVHKAFYNQAYDAIYSLNISGWILTNNHQPFPVAKILVAADTGIAATLSPDGTKIAYLRADANNQPTGYQPHHRPDGGILTPTGLTVIDSAIGKTIATYDASKAQGFGTYTWTLDSQYLLFTTGAFKNPYGYPATPTINTLDLKTGTVTPDGLLSTDPTAHIRELRACATALFYFVDYPRTFPQGDAQPVVTIYSAPLTDLATSSKLDVLSTVAFMTVANCIPPEY